MHEYDLYTLYVSMDEMNNILNQLSIILQIIGIEQY